MGIRERDLPAAELTELAGRLGALARAAGARMVLFGPPEAAVAAGLDAVHLRTGEDLAMARRVLGPGALVGVSVHDRAEAVAAARAGADYVLLGPAFPTASKPGYGPTLGPAGLAAATGLGLPVVAIGGIDAGNAGACLAAGAAGIAVMGGVMRAPDPGAAVRVLLAALDQAAWPAAQPDDQAHWKL